MNDSTAVIIKTVFDYKKPALIIETDRYFVAGIICLIILYIIYQKKIKSKLQNIFVQETSFEINTGLFKYNQKIKRSYQNLYFRLLSVFRTRFDPYSTSSLLIYKVNESAV